MGVSEKLGTQDAISIYNSRSADMVKSFALAILYDKDES